MADHQPKLQAFVKLGDFLREFCEYVKYPDDKRRNINPHFIELEKKIGLASQKNGWFTKENVVLALQSWGKLLTEPQLQDWLSPYNQNKTKGKTVALIMAGNIPLVGFHDFLSVLITGNKVLVKLSSNDDVLLPFIADFLVSIEPTLTENINFRDGQLKDFDAVIATGSDNTSRYFNYYFRDKPNIIRKNRNSVAVLTGKETPEMLLALGEDIFRYYGLGCRSVSKLFVPEGYDFDLFFKSIYDYNSIINNKKYANNYDYNKAVYLMSKFNILDNGFLMLKKDEQYGSPIATVFYDHYRSLDTLKQKLMDDSEKLQCIVAQGVVENEIPFGRTQEPSLMDYADGVDTVEFLLRT